MVSRTSNNSNGAARGGVRRQGAGMRRSLEELALVPVPAPAARFADELLVRLVTNRPAVAAQSGRSGQMDPGQLLSPVPKPATPLATPPTVPVAAGPAHARGAKPSPGRLAVAAVAAAAAVLLLLPPTLDLVESDSSRPELATASLASQLGARSEVRVGPRGVLLDRAGRPLVVEDGAATLTCSAAMTFEDATGGAYRCEAGESVAVRVQDATVGWSSAMPTETGLGSLRLQAPGVELPLRWTWSPFDGPKQADFAAYELVRGRGNEPALADGTATEVVARIEDVGRTTVEEAEAPDDDATYQVRVVDRNGHPLALSNAVQVSVASGG